MRNNLAKSIYNPLGRSRFYWTLNRDRISQILKDYPIRAKDTAKINRNLDLFIQVSRDNRTFNELALAYGLNRSTVRDIVYDMYVKTSNSVVADILYYKRNRDLWLTKVKNR